MNVIEFDHRKPSADDPRKLEYAGQRTAAEVFEELKHRLESQGYLPDEYFLLDSFWENGREIPKDAGIFCTTDYGGSEGVYLDAYLKWYDKGHEKSVTQKFFTGKTLGENGNDLDRMFLISSAITKAFHGDHATHARYMKIRGVEEDTGGRVVHLSRQEEKVIIDALVEQRERQEQAMSQTEQLLRRMTGNMDTVGQRPLRLDDYDRAVLAIRDGELSAFQTLLPNLKDRAHDLLIEAAGRPGIVAVLSPIILVIAFLCALASGSATHNISAAELCFYGGELPADTPEEYRTYIEDMRTSFGLLDGFISTADGKTEEEKSLDEIRVKGDAMALSGKAAKRHPIFVMRNVVSPIRPSIGGIDPARERNGVEGRGTG